jgi:hypothetical protein
VSTTTPSTPSAAQARPSSLTVYGHSSLFYWWPVWAVGFLLAGLTYWGGNVLAVVPAGTVAEKARQVQGVDGTRDVLILPAGQELPQGDVTGKPEQPTLSIARSNGPGAVFVTVVLLVILITNIRLTGMASLIVIGLILLLSAVFALLGVWDSIFRFLNKSDVHITAAGYLAVSLPLFLIWLGVLLFYDRLTYVRFGRGQFTIHHVFGAGATSHDALGVSLVKKRDDLFRHWLLGMGSGDLVIRTAVGNAQTFELPNVLFVGSKLALAQRLLQERQVVKA